MGPAIFVPIFRKSDNSEENKMSGCGCSFSPAEEIKEEVKYTDALAEQFAKEVGVDPRPNETLVEIDERGAFIRQPNAFIQPFGDEEGDLKAEANRYGTTGQPEQLLKQTDHCKRSSWTSGCDLRYQSDSFRRD